MTTKAATRERIDMRDLVAGLHTRLIGPDDLMVLGGGIDAGTETLGRFLRHWRDIPLDFMLCNDTERIGLTAIGEDGVESLRLPVAAEFIERLRCFGVGSGTDADALPAAGGDLEMRRDGKVFRWRFVGTPVSGLNGCLRDAGFDSEDFWDRYPDTRMRRRNCSMLLWGEKKRDVGGFFEARVGWADLSYPGGVDNGRAEVTYLEFTTGGQVALVWWTGVRKHG